MRSCLVLAAVLSLGLQAVSPGAARPLDDVKAAGTLRVAVYEDYAPFSYREGGQATGIDVAIAGHVAEALGARLELVFITSSETLEADLRLNFLRGDLAGSPLSDVMMHVPHDKQFEAQQDMVFLAAPYFEEQIAIAYDKDVVPELKDFGDLAGRSVAVEVASIGDFLLMMTDDGRYRNDLRHYRTFTEAMGAFLNGEAPIIVGARSEIEGGVHQAGRPLTKVGLMQLPETRLVRRVWPVGIAVRADSRDLAYEIANVLTKLRQGGVLDRIFASFGVRYRGVTGY